MYTSYTTVYMRNDNPQNPQVDVVTVRPDEAAKKFLKQKFRSREALQNKSRLYRHIFSLGIEALKSKEVKKENA